MTKKKTSRMAEETQENKPSTQPEQEETRTETLEDLIIERPEQPGEIRTEELGNLQQELAEAQAKATEYLDGWQRSRAEFANYRKRVEREQAETYQRAAGNIIKRFVEILDDLELALRNRPTQGDGAAWSNGIELIYRKLLAILENEGVTQMMALGFPFDPNFHEAIAMAPSDQHQSGTVIEIVKQGYLLGDRILRPALVRVAE